MQGNALFYLFVIIIIVSKLVQITIDNTLRVGRDARRLAEGRINLVHRDVISCHVSSKPYRAWIIPRVLRKPIFLERVAATGRRQGTFCSLFPSASAKDCQAASWLHVAQE